MLYDKVHTQDVLKNAWNAARSYIFGSAVVCSLNPELSFLPLPFFLDSSAFFAFSIQVIILLANSACFWPSCVKDNNKHTLMRTLFNINAAKSTHK